MAIIDQNNLNKPFPIPNPQVQQDYIEYNLIDLQETIQNDQSFDYNIYEHNIKSLDLTKKEDRELYRAIFKVEAPIPTSWTRNFKQGENTFIKAYIPYWPDKSVMIDPVDALQTFKDQISETFGSKDFWKKQGADLLSNIVSDLFKPLSKTNIVDFPDYTLIQVNNTLKLWGTYFQNDKKVKNFEEEFIDRLSDPSSTVFNARTFLDHNKGKRVKYRRLIPESYSPFFEKTTGFENSPMALMNRIGSDFLSHKFDAYWLWNLHGIDLKQAIPWATAYQRGILSKEGFAVRFGQISIPKISNKSFSLPILETQINKVGSTKEMSNQASFTFRLDQDLIWLDAINALTGRVNTLDEAIANSSGNWKNIIKDVKKALDPNNATFILNQDGSISNQHGVELSSKSAVSQAQMVNDSGHLYIAAQEQIGTSNKNQLDWRKLFKTVAQTWPTDAKNTLNNKRGFNIKQSKLSLMIKMEHLGNMVNSSIQMKYLPYILFENVKILGTSDKISYIRGDGDIQSITVNFIYKRKYIIMPDNYKEYPNLKEETNIFNTYVLLKSFWFNTLNTLNNYNKDIMKRNELIIKGDTVSDANSAGFFAGLVNKLFPKDQGLFHLGGGSDV